ncbi:hypothetical protein Tco_1018642 [Tanacetum coccineum]|uniref:Uncharacterized protein n=1 Tax=Tanacetum coccineum TaxID=301880 RepID=A0ABQ5FXF6_9ASTR
MANIRTCNKHNMIACVEKTAQNADFYQIIDYLTGCSINYSLLVDPDLIGPWLQQFWATASLRVINDVPHIRATVAGKKVLISEETIRADLLFDDADGVDCFPKQVIWDSLRDIGYEGNLAQLTFSKPLFSPQWKYLIHVLLHCLSPKSTSWEQFGTNIASALVGLATNQKFNFSLMIMNGMLGHISNGTPFLMYPRFIQLFLNKQLEGVTRPKNFLPSVTLPSKVFTFMRKHSLKFSCRITPLTPPMLEVVTALAAEEAHSTSPHSRATSSPRDAQGSPDQSAAQASISQGTAKVQGTDNSQGTAEVQGTDNSQGTAEVQGTDNSQGTAEVQGLEIEGLLDLYALNREVRRLKKQTLSQAKLIRKLKAKLRKLQSVQSTARQSTITPRTLDFDDEAGPSSPIRPTQEEGSEEQFKVDEVLANISRPRGLSIPGLIQSQPQPPQPSQATDPKDKGKGILVEEPKKKKLTLKQIRALETTNDEEVARKIQAEWDAEEERKRFEELKKAKPKTTLRKPTSLAQERNQMMNFLKGQGYKNLQKLKYPQMKELYDKVQESIKDSFKDFIPMDSEREKQMLKERDEKRLLRKRKATISEEQPSKKVKLRTETVDELRNYLRIVDFEKNAQDRESLEGISMITELQVIDSPDGEYLIIHRANNHFRAFDTLWEILHILDRQDLYHLYRVVQDYYEHIPPTGLGLILLGDLTTIWETAEISDDDFWKNQEDWEIVRWRLNESSGDDDKDAGNMEWKL